jgi:hypothetical protein
MKVFDHIWDLLPALLMFAIVGSHGQWWTISV